MTKLRILLLLPCLTLALFTAPRAFAQDDATRILAKMRQLDLLNQLLPVLMTPEQLQKLLDPVEKARRAERDIQKEELAEMKKVEGKLDSAIKEAKEKSQVPSTDMQAEVFKMLAGFQKKRAVMVIEQNEAVLKAVEETLDSGQIKAAANALAMPPGDTTKLTDRDKLRRWVRAVLMDPLAYDLLVELSKKK